MQPMPLGGVLKKVLLVGRVNTVGGSAQVVRMLHQGLARRGIEVQTAFPAASRQDLEPWYGLPADYPAGVVRAADRATFDSARQFLEYLRSVEFDVMNIHYSGLT